MRAHISHAAARPLALVYGMGAETEAGRTLRALLRAMGIGVREIAPPELSQTMGMLAGLGGKTAAPFAGTPPEEAMLVFHAFSGTQLDNLLDAMRAAELSVPYKAVLTEQNQKWSAAALLEELKQEHAAIEQGRRNGQ